MDGPEKFLHGFLKISVSGDQLERFLNLCHAREIPLERICRQTENSITAYISIADFRRLTLIHRKTKVHIHILEKRGLPFWLYKSRRRKAFLTGFLLCAALLFWLSGHIWNIHIDGNVKNSTPQLLEFLDQQGVIHGISRNQVNCARIAALLRENYPDITFVSARVQGTRLLLTIQEEALTEELQETEAPCNLISNLDGKIVNIVIRNGTPQVKTGDICKQGDILVSGEVPIMNDSQEVVRTEYVPADADIYVRHEIPYYQEFPLSYNKKVKNGDLKISWYLHAGHWILGMDTSGKKQYVTSVQEFPWKLTENFVLPFSLGKITRTPYKIQKAVYTKEQAKEKAARQLKLYEKKLLEKGIRIVSSSLSVTVDSTDCTTKGILTVDEKCGQKQSVEFAQKPEVVKIS